MTMLLKQILSDPFFILWPCVSLIIFVSVMIGSFLWVFRPGSKEFYDQIRYQALDKEKNYDER